MAESAKVGNKVLKITKYVVYLPMLLILPAFFNHFSERTLVLLSLLIEFYFVCFMGPIYLLRYLIGKFDFSQKITDIVSSVSLFCMYVFSIVDWIKVFMGHTYNYSSALFLVPFIAFLRVSFVMMCFSFLWLVCMIIKKLMKKTEKA